MVSPWLMLQRKVDLTHVHAGHDPAGADGLGLLAKRLHVIGSVDGDVILRVSSEGVFWEGALELTSVTAASKAALLTGAAEAGVTAALVTARAP